MLVFHLSVGVIVRFVAPLVGDNNSGIVGVKTILVKLQIADHPEVPLSFDAFTRQ